MHVKSRGGGRWGAVLVAALLPVFLMPGNPAAVADDGAVAQIYVGAQFANGLRASPTSPSHQSKLWFHDDAWWALMIDSVDRTLRVFELRPDHVWRATRTVIASNPSDTGDTLPEGETVYVLSGRTDDVLQSTRLRYDRAAREYLVSLPPAAVTSRPAAGPATIAKDSTGRLWASYATNQVVQVAYSDSDGADWSEPFDLPAPEASFSGREVAAVVAFNSSVGVIWSDQADGAFRFAVHTDGSPPDEWSGETALSGPAAIDNQINIKVVRGANGDRLVAAVRAAPAEPGAHPDTPLNHVLVRAPDGTWSRVAAGSLGDDHAAAVLQVDETNGLLYFLAYADGAIQQKQAALDTLAFGPGRGRPFLQIPDAAFADVVGSKQLLDAGTGLVALSSVAASRTYHHAELAVAGEPPPPAEGLDDDPPTAPGTLLATPAGQGAVSLSWAPADDGDRWSPAADRAPVSRYAIFRNGVEVGTTTQNSFADTPPPDAGTMEYAVRSVDRAGNLSGPSIASLAVPQDPSNTAPLIGWALLGVAGALAAAVGIPWWRRNRTGRTL